MVSWAYLAGFFDGEGTIHTSAKVIRWSVTQSPAGLSALQAIQHFLSEQGIRSGIIPNRYHYKGQPKVMHVLVISRKADVRRVCGTLIPHLHVKRTTALDAWRFLTLYPALLSR